jgi:hypothetical protein
MIKDLIKIADRLDAMGLFGEANLLDKLIKISSNFEPRTVDEVIARFKGDYRLWNHLRDEFEMMITSPENLESTKLKEIYPGWEMQDFDTVFKEMEGYSLISGIGAEELMLLLAEHLNESSEYTISDDILSKIITALDQAGVKGMSAKELIPALADHMNKYSDYVIPNNALQKIVSALNGAGISGYDLNDFDKSTLRMMKLYANKNLNKII